MSNEETAEDSGPVIIYHALKDYPVREEDRAALQIVYDGMASLIAAVFYPEKYEMHALMHGFAPTPANVHERNEARSLSDYFRLEGTPVERPALDDPDVEAFLNSTVVLQEAQRLALGEQFGNVAAAPPAEQVANYNRAPAIMEPSVA